MNNLNHIGIIMDGNGRWGERQNKSRRFGHDSGVKTFEKTIEWCIEEKISYLTVYAFSTENWNRCKTETDYLLRLFKQFLVSKKSSLVQKGIRFKVLGDLSILDRSLMRQIHIVEESTRDNSKIHVQFCFNYGGKNEIVRAIRKIVSHNSEIGRLADINEALVERYLDTYTFPEIDLVVRTGEHKRLSNFMIWQSAYAEVFFSNILWPDFDKAELKKAIDFFKSSRRNFGGVREQS